MNSHLHYERVKRHRKKRIDKKWLVRYGFKAVRRTMDSEELKGKTIIDPEPTKVCEKSDDGKHSWMRGMHIDYRDKAVNVYTCEKCGEVVNSTYYRDDDDLMYWG